MVPEPRAAFSSCQPSTDGLRRTDPRLQCSYRGDRDRVFLTPTPTLRLTGVTPSATDRPRKRQRSRLPLTRGRGGTPAPPDSSGADRGTPWRVAPAVHSLSGKAVVRISAPLGRCSLARSPEAV